MIWWQGVYQCWAKSMDFWAFNFEFLARGLWGVSPDRHHRSWYSRISWCENQEGEVFGKRGTSGCRPCATGWMKPSKSSFEIFNFLIPNFQKVLIDPESDRVDSDQDLSNGSPMLRKRTLLWRSGWSRITIKEYGFSKTAFKCVFNFENYYDFSRKLNDSSNCSHIIKNLYISTKLYQWVCQRIVFFLIIFLF